MTRTVRITSAAEEDLYQAWKYIARDSLIEADATLRRVAPTLDVLMRSPHLGQPADEFRKGLRRFVAGNYVIYYLVDQDGIIVIRVLHQARDHDAEL